jgi:hypothetical protein
MEETNKYRIKIHGKLDVQPINESSPIAIIDSIIEKNSTLLTIQSDQSGLIGLLRYLHARGVIFESINRERKHQEKEKE